LTKACGDRAKAQNVVGNAALHVGDRVTLEPGTTCRMCTDCRSGRYQVRTCGL
jgi:D-xylulose reductase